MLPLNRLRGAVLSLLLALTLGPGSPLFAESTAFSVDRTEAGSSQLMIEFEGAESPPPGMPGSIPMSFEFDGERVEFLVDFGETILVPVPTRPLLSVTAFGKRIVSGDAVQLDPPHDGVGIGVGPDGIATLAVIPIPIKIKITVIRD